MKFKYFIGIDVSKDTLDLSIVEEGKQLLHKRIGNNQKEIKAFITFFKKEFSTDLNSSLYCMEHTGIYTNHLLNVLNDKSIAIWLESAFHIKQSLGLQRGKNDKVDAKRIALYAYKNRDEVKLWQPTRNEVKKLKQLVVIRKRIVKTISNLKKPLSDTSFLSKEEKKTLNNSLKLSLNALKKDLGKIDTQIQEVINEDQHLKKIFRLTTSVKGVGTITAIQIIVKTNEFKSISEAKKFACYAGVAPFEHSSGSSVRGRSRVSNMADKSMKSTLHMAALAAVNYQGELRDYYLKKVEEGKNKMSILNAVRNKLILRVFACVKNNREYENNYAY